MLLLHRLGRPRAHQRVDRGHHVLREVEDPLQVAGRDVEQQSQAAGDALGEPDVGHRGGQRDVPHALTADLGACHLDAAPVADHALVADLLVLAAVALPVLRGTEDALAEQPVLLRPKRAVINGLRLRDLAVGPLFNLFR